MTRLARLQLAAGVILCISGLRQTARADPPTDVQIAAAVAEYQSAAKSLQPADAAGRLKAAQSALKGMHVLEMSADQISSVSRTGMLNVMGYNGWAVSPQQQEHFRALTNSGWIDACWPYGGPSLGLARLYELAQLPTVEGAKACVAAVYFIPPALPGVPEQQSRVTDAATVSWIRRTCEHVAMTQALNAGVCADLPILLDARFTDSKLLARCTRSIESLERVLTPELPPIPLARFDRVLDALAQAPDARWLVRERIRWKVKQLLPKATARIPAGDMSTPGEIAGMNKRLAEIEQRIAQLDAQVKEDTAAGAAAALARLRYPPVAMDAADASQVATTRRAASEVLARALTHPRLADALRAGDGTLFESFGQFDPAVVDAALPAILKLAPVIPESAPASLALATRPLVELLARHQETDAATREALRQKVIKLIGTTIAALPAAEAATKAQLDIMQKQVGSTWAQGQLVGKPTPSLSARLNSHGDDVWPGFERPPSSLSDFEGRVLVLYFWEIGRSQSVEGLNWIRQLEDRYAGCPMTLLAVADHLGAPGSAEQNLQKQLEAVDAYLAERRITTTVVLVSENASERFGTFETPGMAIVDPKGIVRYAALIPDFKPIAESDTSKTIDALLREFKLTLPGTPEAAAADLDQRVDAVVKNTPRKLADFVRQNRGNAKSPRARQIMLNMLPDQMMRRYQINPSQLSIAHLIRLRPIIHDNGPSFGIFRSEFMRVADRDDVDGAEAGCAGLTTLTPPDSIGPVEKPQSPTSFESNFVLKVLHHKHLAEAFREGRAEGFFTFVSRTHPQTIKEVLEELLKVAETIPNDTAAVLVPRFGDLVEGLKRHSAPPERVEAVRKRLLSVAQARQTDVRAGKVVAPRGSSDQFFAAQVDAGVKRLEGTAN